VTVVVAVEEPHAQAPATRATATIMPTIKDHRRLRACGVEGRASGLIGTEVSR
jgi:hypothetical protein